MISPGNFINELPCPSSHVGISVQSFALGLTISSVPGKSGLGKWVAFSLPFALFAGGEMDDSEETESSILLVLRVRRASCFVRAIVNV